MDINKNLIQSSVHPIRDVNGKSGLFFKTTIRDVVLSEQFIPIDIVYHMYKWFRAKERKELELEKILENPNEEVILP